jgi:hypothetical protein
METLEIISGRLFNWSLKNSLLQQLFFTDQARTLKSSSFFTTLELWYGMYATHSRDLVNRSAVTSTCRTFPQTISPISSSSIHRSNALDVMAPNPTLLYYYTQNSNSHRQFP